MGPFRIAMFCLLTSISIFAADAQSPESYSALLTQQVKSGKLSPLAHVQDYVIDGRLHLRLEDAVHLALENNSNIRIEETQVEAQKFTLLGAYKPFDPLFQSSANVNRLSYSGYTQLQGVGETNNAALNTLSQTVQASYTQTFMTGTNIFTSFSSNRNSTNSAFYFLNPYVNSTVTLQFTQPLLRNAGRFANKGSCDHRTTGSAAIARQLRGASQRRYPAGCDAILGSCPGTRKLRC